MRARSEFFDEILCRVVIPFSPSDEWLTVAKHKLLPIWGVFEKNVVEIDHYGSLERACESMAQLACDRTASVLSGKSIPMDPVERTTWRNGK